MNKIKFTIGEKGRINFVAGPPFDGKPVLIKLAAGWCEAWFCDDTAADPYDPDGGFFGWVCMDDKFQAEWDEAKYWAPLPTTDA